MIAWQPLALNPSIPALAESRAVSSPLENWRNRQRREAGRDKVTAGHFNSQRTKHDMTDDDLAVEGYEAQNRQAIVTQSGDQALPPLRDRRRHAEPGNSSVISRPLASNARHCSSYRLTEQVCCCPILAPAIHGSPRHHNPRNLRLILRVFEIGDADVFELFMGMPMSSIGRFSTLRNPRTTISLTAACNNGGTAWRWRIASVGGLRSWRCKRSWVGLS